MAVLSVEMVSMLRETKRYFLIFDFNHLVFSFRADCISKEAKAPCEKQVIWDSFKGKAKEKYTIKRIWKPTSM